MEIIYRLGDNGMQNSAIVFSFCAYSKVILVTLIPSTMPYDSSYWSPYISLKNQWRSEFVFRIFTQLIILLILVTYSLDYLDISGENWCWSFLGLKGLTLIDR